MINTVQKEYQNALELNKLINSAENILIIQADNPDSDSLGSALLMESIAGKLHKNTYLYCGIDMPTYIKYIEGWDRVEKNIPNNFDLTIFVDVSTITLFEKLNSSLLNKIKQKPSIVLDHHKTTAETIDFASVIINDTGRASTGELIYLIAKQLHWTLDVNELNLVANTILGDTQGLSNQLATPGTYRIMADMIESGVDRPVLEDRRREQSKMPLEIFKYKADLINKCEFHYDNKIALATIGQVEINKYSPSYNPSALIQGDLLQTEGVLIAIVFKIYDDGHITASIRCNTGAPMASKLAQEFQGGGHDYASGFKIINESFTELKNKVLTKVQELLLELK